jgi:hypothetical protein
LVVVLAAAGGRDDRGRLPGFVRSVAEPRGAASNESRSDANGVTRTGSGPKKPVTLQSTNDVFVPLGVTIQCIATYTFDSSRSAAPMPVHSLC